MRGTNLALAKKRSQFTVMNIMNDIVTVPRKCEQQKVISQGIMNDKRSQVSVMNHIVNNIMGHNIVNNSFAYKPDGLLVIGGSCSPLSGCFGSKILGGGGEWNYHSMNAG